MGRKIYVGADGGGTKTAICALGCLPGNQVFSCQGASMNYNVIGVEKAAVHFAEAMSRLPMARGMEIAAVAIGDPSIDDLVPSPLTGQFLNRVRQLVPPLSMCPIYVASDVYMTLYGMTGGEPGAIMVSGTGSMGLAQDPKGRLHVVAGWGRLIEGEGSGYFIASRGLRAALRYYEGTGPKTVLLEEMKRYFGIQDPRDFVLRYYADSTAFPDVAGFAKVVGDAAGQDEEIWMTEEENYCIHGYPERMVLEFSYENPEVSEGLELHLAQRENSEVNTIFPVFDCQEPGANILFLPLHFRQWTVGYLVIRDSVYLMERQYLHHMLGALTKAMENLHRHEKLEWMNEQLSNLYVRDTLTGMYNRMGYRKFAGTLFEDRKRANNLLILFIDLDRLKFINDNLGHDMGDLAIRAVADAIKSSLDEEGIPVRLGGDEFLVICEEPSGQEIENMIREIRHKVEHSGNQVGLYELSISAGYVITDKESPKKLEDYVNEADAIMYEEKKAKKAART